MKLSQKQCLLSVIVMVALFILLPIFVIGPCVVRSIEVPQIQKLAAIDSSEMHFTTTLPPGNYFNLVLGVPKDQTSPRGFVSIKEAGQPGIEYEISSERWNESGWGEMKELQGYKLTLPGNPEPSSKGFLRGRHTYDFVLRFTNDPPAGSSLWITWLQRGID